MGRVTMTADERATLEARLRELDGLTGEARIDRAAQFFLAERWAGYDEAIADVPASCSCGGA